MPEPDPKEQDWLDQLDEECRLYALTVIVAPDGEKKLIKVEI